MKHLFPRTEFLVIAVIITSRILAVGEVRMGHDEVRSVTRTFGTPAQIIAWQPPDWPPLYYLVLGAYRAVAGFHPLIIRYSSVLLFTLSLAALYPLGLRLFKNRQAAVGVIAAYATVGLILFQSTHVRGYVLALALFPIALWLTLRFFETDKPQWTRAFVLAVILVLLFYTTYSVVPGFFLLGLFTLIAFPVRRIWRWIMPALIAIPLVMPQLWDLAQYILPTLARRESTQVIATDFTLEPYAVYQWVLLRNYAGATWILWILLCIGAIGILFYYYERKLQRSTLALLVCAIVAPVFAAAVLPFFGMASPHYSWWAVFPFVLLVGKAIGYLPRRVWLSIVTLLLIVPFLPVPIDNFRYGNIFHTPFEDTFTWLDQHLEPGDVIYLDESCTSRYEKCGTGEEWDYYQRVYFPDRRLHIVDNLEATADARRVWYVHVEGWHDEAAKAAIADGRVQSGFIGPWDFLWQLYEAPPDREGILYENGMRFHGFDVLDPLLQGGYVEGAVARREGESLILRLWWSVDEPVTQDYSISTVIAPALDAPALAQVDSPPQTISLFPFVDAPPPETSQWQPQQYYIEERVIPIPQEVDSGLRDSPIGVYLTVYYWEDGQPILAPGVSEIGRLRLRDIFILTY
jgi:hypothetical protein